MSRLPLAGITFLLVGCAGWDRDRSARLRIERSDPEPREVRCERVPVAEVATSGIASISVQRPRGRVPVGELFDWWRRPEAAPEWLGQQRHRMVVDADAFGRRVQTDIERLLRIGATGAGPVVGPQLVVTISDVRTAAHPAALTELRGRVASRIVLRAAVLDDRGDALWSGVFTGESDKRVFYFRLVHHETTLSAAYCAALTRFRAAVPGLAGALGGAAVAPVTAVGH